MVLFGYLGISGYGKVVQWDIKQVGQFEWNCVEGYCGRIYYGVQANDKGVCIFEEVGVNQCFYRVFVKVDEFFLDWLCGFVQVSYFILFGKSCLKVGQYVVGEVGVEDFY